MRRRVPAALKGLATLLLAFVATVAVPAILLAGGRVAVRGYFRRDGTYVQPYFRTAPDGNPFNNYSFPGNYNPNTGTITPGNPDTYLRRYYERSAVGSAGVPAAPSAPVPLGVVPDVGSGAQLPTSATSPARSAVPPGTGAGLPEHAHLSYLGHEWECDRGYYQLRDHCERIVVPQHAHVSYLGHEWECDRGYYQLRDRCEPLAVPEHAHVGYLGHEWECDRGYYQAREHCELLTVPQHAHVGYLGHEWECDRGYQQARDGCAPVGANVAPGTPSAGIVAVPPLVGGGGAPDYTYDVSGSGDSGEVSGTIDAERGSRDVDGTVYDEDGNEHDVTGEWSGKGTVDAWDDDGNS